MFLVSAKINEKAEGATPSAFFLHISGYFILRAAFPYAV